MLSLVLMLLSDPLAQASAPVPTPDPEIRLRVMDALNVPRCDPNGLQRIERPLVREPGVRNDLMFRPGDEVRRYLLLDRTVRGCPAPISYAVPYPGATGPRPAPADPAPDTGAPGLRDRR